MQVRCMMCGRPAAADDREVEAKVAAQQEAVKQGKESKMVWICPECSGRTRNEAERSGKGLKRKT